MKGHMYLERCLLKRGLQNVVNTRSWQWHAPVRWVTLLCWIRSLQYIDSEIGYCAYGLLQTKLYRHTWLIVGIELVLELNTRNKEKDWFHCHCEESNGETDRQRDVTNQNGTIRKDHSPPFQFFGSPFSFNFRIPIPAHHQNGVKWKTTMTTSPIHWGI